MEYTGQVTVGIRPSITRAFLVATVERWQAMRAMLPFASPLPQSIQSEILIRNPHFCIEKRFKTLPVYLAVFLKRKSLYTRIHIYKNIHRMHIGGLNSQTFHLLGQRFHLVKHTQATSSHQLVPLSGQEAVKCQEAKEFALCGPGLVIHCNSTSARDV